MAFGAVLAAAVGAGVKKYVSGKSGNSPDVLGGKDPNTINVGTSSSTDGASGDTLGSEKRRPVEEFLGSEKGALAKNIGGQYLSGHLGQRRFEKNFGFLRSQGLTPWEIGGGGAGSTVHGAGSNILGNGPAQAGVTQQKLQIKLKREELASKERIAKIQVGPSKTQASTAIDRLREDKKVNMWKINLISKQMDSVSEDIIHKRLQNDNFWGILASHMGPENLHAAALMALAQVNQKSMLNALELDEKGRKALQSMLLYMRSKDGKIRQEVEGLLGLIGMGRAKKEGK